MRSVAALAVIVLAAVAAVIFVPRALSSSSAADPTTYQGKTAFQWHRIAVIRRVERDRARSHAGDAIRAGLRADRHYHAELARLEAGGVLTSSLERSFLCIHGYEGSWTDPGEPYYGGLQMDLEFQRTYGGDYLRAWGTADHWPVAVQLAVAMRAYLTRGFHPWPNTAHSCGLL